MGRPGAGDLQMDQPKSSQFVFDQVGTSIASMIIQGAVNVLNGFVKSIKNSILKSRRIRNNSPWTVESNPDPTNIEHFGT
jgi:hypothetical protein